MTTPGLELLRTPSGEEFKPKLTKKAEEKGLRSGQGEVAIQVAEYIDQGFFVILEAPCGKGKAQPLSEPVLTSTGWKSMREIQVGDTVFDMDGKPVRVTGVFPQGEKKIVRIGFSDLSWARCCEDHLWTAKSINQYNKNKWNVRAAKEIRSKLKCNRNFVWQIPLCREIQFPSQPIPIDPYFFGMLLGNGGFTAGTPSFSSNDLELVARMINECQKFNLSPTHKEGPDWDMGKGCKGNSPNELTLTLRSLGLYPSSSRTKFIPDIYLFNSPEVRLNVLRGIQDTDGSPCSGGTASDYCCASQELMNGVRFLVQSLGGTAREGIPKIVDGWVYPRTYIKLNQCPFSLKRKYDLWNHEEKRFRPKRIIKSIENDGFEKCQCISVESETHTYITRSFIVTHNTLIADLVRQCLMDTHKNPMRMLYVPPQITLQKQFYTDNPGSASIKGRANYHHGRDPHGDNFPTETCADCKKKDLCDDDGNCGGYRQDKEFFLGADVGIANLSYYLTAANFLGMFSARRDFGGSQNEDGSTWEVSGCKFITREKHVILGDIGGYSREWGCEECGSRKGPMIYIWRMIERKNKVLGDLESKVLCRDCLGLHEHVPMPEEWSEMVWRGFGWCGKFFSVFDEADVIESSLMNFCKLEIPMGFLITMATQIGEIVPKPPIMNADDLWWDWLQSVEALATQAFEMLATQREEAEEKSIVLDRWIEAVRKFIQKIRKVDPTWIYQAHRDQKQGEDGKNRRVGGVNKVVIQPLHVEETGGQFLWRYVGPGMAMSGTFQDFKQWTKETGLEASGVPYKTIRVGSDWDRWRRPIFRCGLNVTKPPSEKWKDQPVWVDVVDTCTMILTRQPDERTAIMVASYEFGVELANSLDLFFGDRIFLHTSEMGQAEKEGLLDQYKEKEGAIIISPCIRRGVDLAYDLCRKVIDTKCPFPSLGEKRIAARRESEGGQQWYAVQTIRELVQGWFRGVRAGDDWCEIWMLDSVNLDRLLERKNCWQGYITAALRPVKNYNVPASANWREIEARERAAKWEKGMEVVDSVEVGSLPECELEKIKEVRECDFAYSESEILVAWNAGVDEMRNELRAQNEVEKQMNSKPLEAWPFLGLCGVCGGLQFGTPCGSVCKNGHGGAPTKDAKPWEVAMRLKSEGFNTYWGMDRFRYVQKINEEEDFLQGLREECKDQIDDIPF